MNLPITAALLLAAVTLTAYAADPAPTAASEHQRHPDLANGSFQNPILPGDHADPTILKDGDDYYMTHSSFFRYPGLLLWHSKDLVNWQPLTSALTKNVGTVWAPDLCKVGARYFLYFPGRTDTSRSIYVIYADNIRGPWSDPIDLHLTQIDPGHAIDQNGHRFLFLSGGLRVPLSDDGLSTNGKPVKVYDGWQYPQNWLVESFSLEGPKITRHGDYYYLLNAEGGTAGPPTSHMVVAARSKSLDGPWENDPRNPIIHTRSRDETWWSKGHGSLVEGPHGQWYIVYHAYENGFYTLGRQTLLEPIAWTDDGWFKSTGIDVAAPIPKPDAPALPFGFPFSDDFSTNKMGIQWSFHNGATADAARFKYENNALIIQGKGSSPKDCSPLAFSTGDHAYQCDVQIEITDDSRAGLILFYNEKLYAGLGFDKSHLFMHRYGAERQQALPKNISNTLHLRLTNDKNILTLDTSPDGKTWTRFPTAMDVSGYHHNTAGDFLSLRPALYSAGAGSATFKNFHYHALP
jgi:beta-xylosidase